jgi:hypothetical protein
MVSVLFSVGKLGMAPPGCVSEVTEMECGRSDIEELIKEVGGGSGPWGLQASSGLVPSGQERHGSCPAKASVVSDSPGCGTPTCTGGVRGSLVFSPGWPPVLAGF